MSSIRGMTVEFITELEYYPVFVNCFFVYFLLATNNVKTMAKNMEKLQTDREFLQSVLSRTMEEVKGAGTVEAMKNSIKQYRQEKEDMEQTIKRYACVCVCIISLTPNFKYISFS